MKIYMFCLLGVLLLVSLFSIYAKKKRDKNEPLFSKPNQEDKATPTKENAKPGRSMKRGNNGTVLPITDLLGIKEIEKGIFHKENNEYCVVIEANFVNFDLKSDASKTAILLAYQALFRVVKFPIQILGQSVSQDMRKEEARFENNLKNKPAAVQIYNKSVLKHIKNRSENEFRVTKKLYYLISYSHTDNRLGNITADKKKKLLETNLSLRASTIIGMLRGAEIQAHLLDSLSAMEVVKRSLNRDRMNNHPIENVVLDERLATFVTWDIKSIPGIEEIVNGVEELQNVMEKHIPKEEVKAE